MLNVDLGIESEVYDYMTSGYYFKPVSHISKEYLIGFKDTEESIKTTAIIHEVSVTGRISINNGDPICTYNASEICTIDLYGKYFFPRFNNDMQMFYDDNLYYNAEYKTDELTALSEVMNYAIKLGLNLAHIKPY